MDVHPTIQCHESTGRGKNRLDCCYVLFFSSWLFVAAHRLSLVVASGLSSLVVVHGLPIAVTSLVVEHSP